ncbi:DMT family transporter [Treponema primitia]|uniref:DMT family transporter n=1 Tax=Treponema primitia TaxID=88058 RepID=UPI000255567E|nr:DMT family transporter [Treponema primitia]
MDNTKKGLLLTHIAVFLFGLAGLFAKLIHQSAGIIVLGRVLFSSIFLLIFIKVKKYSLKLETKKECLLIVLAGAILALHWTAFTQSVQVSTMAIGTLTMATFPLFVSFLEPLFFHEKLRPINIIYAVIVIIGILFIVPEFELQNKATQGILWGLMASISYAVISLLNRVFSNKYPGMVVSFYEQTAAIIVLLPQLFFNKIVLSSSDIIFLLILALVFTATSHSLFIEGFKYIKVQTAGILTGLEPVYGIIAAFLLFHEKPGIKELVGGVIILSVVLYSTVRQGKKKA